MPGRACCTPCHEDQRLVVHSYTVVVQYRASAGIQRGLIIRVLNGLSEAAAADRWRPADRCARSALAICPSGCTTRGDADAAMPMLTPKSHDVNGRINWFAQLAPSSTRRNTNRKAAETVTNWRQSV